MDYHGFRYLTADQFVSYCNDLKVDLSLSHDDLELYERERVLLPVARVIKPKEYILQRNDADKDSETLGKALPEWTELESLIYGGNADDGLDDLDRAFLDDNKYIVKPVIVGFHTWKEYDVKLANSAGESYTVDGAIHYYHYWQVYQVYELLTTYPIFSKNYWIFKIIKEGAPEKADYLSPVNSTLTVGFYGRDNLFEALSFYINFYRYERQNNEYPSEQFSLKMKEHAVFILERFDLKVEDLYSFLFYLLDLERDYRNYEKFLLADEVKKDIPYLVGLISYAGDITFDDIYDNLKNKIPYWTLEQLRHHDHSLLVNDTAQEDLVYSLKDYNGLFPNIMLTSDDVRELVTFLDENQISIFPFSIYYLVDLLNSHEPIWFTSMYMGLSGMLAGLEAFLSELVRRKNSRLEKKDLYNYFSALYSGDVWWNKFENVQKQLKDKYPNDNLSIISDLSRDDQLSDVTKTFLLVYFMRNYAFHGVCF